MSNPIVVWSGGWDSTLVLMDTLRYNNKQVDAISFTLPGISALKMECEKIARKRFLEWLRVEHPSYSVNCKTIDFIYDEISIIPYGDFPQQVIWTILSSIFAPNDATVLFGFIQGDHYWGIEHSLHEASKQICSAMKKTVTWKNPLKSFYKYEVIQSIHQLGLQDICWTCENPQILMQPCGVCETCWKHKMALKECEMRELPMEKITVSNTDVEVKESETLTV